MAAQLFRTRRALMDAEEHENLLAEEEADWSRYWHKSFQLTDQTVTICQRCRQHRLNKTEREVLVALVLDQLAMLKSRIQTNADLLALVVRPGRKAIDVARMLAEHGRLFLAGLMTFDDPDEDPAARRLIVDPVLVDAVLASRASAESGWGAANELELMDRLQALTQVLMQKSDTMQHLLQGYGSVSEAFKRTRKVDRLLHKLNETLDRHPRWKLAEIRKGRSAKEQIIFLALLGKHLGHVRADETLFTGGGLARAASRSADRVAATLRLLTANGDLVLKEFIRPCSGNAELASNDPAELEQTEFELTENTIQLLGLEKRIAKGRSGDFCARTTTVRLEQMVLSDRLRQAINMLMVHARFGKRLLDDWGLGELIPYGRNPVLLFSGPPGTGKTATAEALAHELGKPILVADYSRIQNCFIGQTEKNVVRAFREAKR